MIPKLTTGNGFGGSLRYDTRQGQGTKSGLAKVLDVSGVEFDIDKDGNYIINTRQVSRDFRAQTMGYQGKRDIRKPVYHWVLSYHPDDKVPEEQMIEDAKNFLKRVGFDDTQYVMTVHYDKKHHHLHIVTNIVDNQGKRIPTMGLIDKAHEAAAAITKERGYTWGAEQEKSNEKEEEKEKGNETETETEENNNGTENKKTKDKKEKEKIHNPHDRARIIVKTVVKEAKSRATSLDEFKNILESQGVSCKVKLANDGERGGISYSIKYEDRVHPFRGSSVGRELSFKYITKAIGENARRAEEAEAAEKLRTYRATWYEQLAPIYDRTFKVCNELYASKREIWNQIIEENQEIKEKFAQIADLNAYNEELKKKLFAAQTSSELMSFIGFLLFFINPLAAIALLTMKKCVNQANLNSNIAERRAVRTEMTRLFNEIGAIKKDQALLKEEAKKLLKDYKESVEEKKIFDDAYKAIKEHMAVPIIAEKFDRISRFVPDAKEVVERFIKKSKNGYDMFFVRIDGYDHVAVDFNGKVVFSQEPIGDTFNLSRLTWKDEEGKEYTFDFSTGLKEKLQEQPNPDAPANMQTTAAPIPAQPVTVPEPQSIKPAGSEKQQAHAPTSESTPMVEKRSDLIETLKQNFPFRDSGHMQYIIESTTDASIFFYGNVKDSKYANFPTEEHYQDGQPRTIDKYEEARDMLKRKVYSVWGTTNSHAFYDALIRKQKDGNFRVGDMQIHPDGKISFGQERIFGDPKLTASIIPLKSEAQNKEVVKEEIKVSTQTSQTQQNPSISEIEKEPVRKELPASYKRVTAFFNKFTEQGGMKSLINMINTRPTELTSYNHLVFGKGELRNESGMIHLDLLTDGCTDGKTMYSEHSPKKQFYGESFIDVVYDESERCVKIIIELDPDFNYEKGRSGVVKYFDDGRIEEKFGVRNYRGILQKHEEKLKREDKQTNGTLSFKPMKGPRL